MLALTRPLSPWPAIRRRTVLLPNAPASRHYFSVACADVGAGASAGASSSAGGDDYHATVRALNSRGRHVPKRSLGQNYMLNPRVNYELVSAADVEAGDVVLEIGPGTGSLTAALLEAGATVVAVEKDKHMATLVKDRFGSSDQLKVIREDITKCHITSHVVPLLEKQKTDRKYAKVVSNIPFNISTEVVKLLLPMGDIFSVVALLLQDEVAFRLSDDLINNTEHRPINVFVNFYSEPEYKFKVERTNFFPRPKVDAAVIKFRLKQVADYPQVASPKSFFSMVNSAFNGKRKMLRKSLQHLHAPIDIETALVSIGLPVTARPSELSLEEFVRLHNILMKV